MTPFYDDGTVTIWCAELASMPAPELEEVAVCVVTSPPYNVGLAYHHDEEGDALAWDRYWRFALAAAEVMARALLPGGAGLGQHGGLGSGVAALGPCRQAAGASGARLG